jgi:hypothetical protein
MIYLFLAITKMCSRAGMNSNLYSLVVTDHLSNNMLLDKYLRNHFLWFFIPDRDTCYHMFHIIGFLGDFF